MMKSTQTMFLRLLALALVFFALGLFAACGGEKDQDSEPNATAEATEGNTDPEKDRFTRIDPGLPEMDFGGYEFNILHWFVALWNRDDCVDIATEELNGDVFNDAVFNRNKTIEDKYNIKITLSRTDINDITNNVRKMIGAGDDSYDLVYQRQHEVMAMVMNGMFCNLLDIPYINFEQPWWDQRANDDFSLDGKVYMAVSDISTSTQESIGCILFNKALAQDYALDNLYNVVERGDWTLDYVTEIIKNFAKDLNGDGKLDNKDFIPFIGGDLLTTILFNGAGSRFAEKDENDMPFCNFNTERNIDVCNKILDFMYDPQLYLNESDGAGDPMFRENQSIFKMALMMDVRKLRDMEVDFGVLPCPKFDKNQSEYYSSVSIHQSGLASVPVTLSDPDRTGIITEALSAESRYTVQPAYYEISLKGKYVRDEESADMLDILFSTRLYDLGSVGHFGGFETEWLRMVSNKKRDIVSLYDKSERAIQSDIDKLIKAIEKLD